MARAAHLVKHTVSYHNGSKGYQDVPLHLNNRVCPAEKEIWIDTTIDVFLYAFFYYLLLYNTPPVVLLHHFLFSFTLSSCYL